MEKKFKIALLIFIMFTLSGCHATYNVSIKGNEIEEDLVINNANFNPTQIDIYTTYPIPVNLNHSCFLDYDTENLDSQDQEKIEGVNYYHIVSEDNTKMRATAKLFVDNYNQSRIANSLFNNLNVNHYPDMISIYGYNGFAAFLTYPDLEDVEINITVDKRVITHNADSVNGNTYTWKFSKNTADDKTLYIEMSKENNKKKKDSSSKFYSGYIILGIFIASLILAGILKIYASKKESEKY